MTAPRLVEAGFKVTVGVLKEGRGALAADLESAGVPVVSFGGRGRYDLRALARLRRALVAGRYDILHAHLFLANVAARLAGRLAGVPVVVTSHHDTDVWMRAPHRLAERLTARWSDRVVTCSEAVRQYAIERHGLPAARVRVVIEWRDGDGVWGTVGVSENIVEASWLALVDAVEYKLFKDEEGKR